MKFAISMLGARMHYAVPRIFYQAGVLQRLYTDICADTSWPQALKFLPSRWIGRGARRLLARRVPDVPLDRVTAFTLFGLEYFWRQKVAAKNGELFEAYLWAGREFGRRVIENGFDGADGVYCFTSAALEIMNAAKQLGLYSVLEQSSSAKAIELSLMREEFQARPGWERPPTHGTALEDFISREESEWALADTIVCPSAWVQSGLKARGVPDAKCVVVPYGVDVDWGQTVQTGPTGGRLHSSGNHKLRVLTVGGVRLQKGSHYVLDAARKLKGACDFRMAGSVFVSKSAQSEICKQIQLLGPVPRSEIARHYSWADVFLLPSVCEGSDLYPQHGKRGSKQLGRVHYSSTGCELDRGPLGTSAKRPHLAEGTFRQRAVAGGRVHDRGIRTPPASRYYENLMRVVVLFDNFGPYHLARLDGVNKVVSILGIEVAGISREYAWDPGEESGNFRIVRLLKGATVDSVSKRELCERLSSALGKASPQAVFVPGWSSRAAMASIEWCRTNSVPALMMSESTEWDEPRVSWKEWTKRRIVGMCSAALVGGRPHADYMAKLGMTPDRVFLGYDAVDNEYFTRGAAESRKQKAAIRVKYGLPENYFLASARFIEKKNLPRLLQAYAFYRRRTESQKTRNTTPPWDLVLLGDGELRPKLEALRASLGLNGCVHMPGFKQYPDLPAYYGLASCFVHASTTEQWGLVVNEAMASGLPVTVSNRCGCAVDLVQDGVNGFTFDPHSVEQLAHLMLKISAFRFPLSAFGSKSQEIIANWSTERFSTGLKLAAETAIKVGPRKATWLDRLLLRLMVLR
jgi:glycosyltransferase involved in cell wall biosynthesis